MICRQVRLVRKKDTGVVWALKSMIKDAMVMKNQVSGREEPAWLSRHLPLQPCTLWVGLRCQLLTTWQLRDRWGEAAMVDCARVWRWLASLGKYLIGRGFEGVEVVPGW